MSRYLWRISNHVSLAGDGGVRAPARWHSKGRPIVYLAESPAGALLEVLVHLRGRRDKMPDSYTLLQVKVDSEVGMEDLGFPQPANWTSDVERSRLRGDEWLIAARVPLARVPSAVMPHTFNCLLNPLHPDAAKVMIVEAVEHRFDPRLL